MSSLLSKIISRIPLLKTIYARLHSLRKENKKFQKRKQRKQSQIDSLNQEISELKQEKKQNKKDLQKLERRQQRREASLESDFPKKMEYTYFSGLQPEEYEENLKEWYLLRTGQTLNLDDPQTYNEKIQWLKLYDSTPLKTRLSDKYLVRDWVREKIGEEYLIPLLGVYDKFDDIDFDVLPNQFVIKTNHACKTNRIVTDKAQFDKQEAKIFFDRKMQINYAFWNGLELQYQNISPRILIESYLENQGQQLSDYKVLCFEGKPQFIEYITDRNIGEKCVFFDTDWNRMPFSHNLPPYKEEVKRPARLEEMLEVSKILSEGFTHVRVDLYSLDDGSLKFGEMTFTPASGIGKWKPEKYNSIMGSYITCR